jgi:hypothetical protein
VSDFRLPRANDRIAIVGRNGTGKTTMAVWLLSHADYDRKPHLIVDYKGEVLFRDLQKIAPDGITEISVTGNMPTKKGLYIVRPVPSIDDEAIERMLWKVWENQRTGVYVDECHLLPSNDALKACLVTGRSRQIPMTIISQRPVWVPREAFSEANHHIAFDISRRDDRKTAGEFMMREGDPIPRWPNYHSMWHDVERNQRYHMLPPPVGRESVRLIAERAPRRFRWF